MKKKISKFLHPIFETTTEFCEWYGYYNYDTLNHDQTKMLCNRAMFDGVDIKKGMTIELGYYNIASNVWHRIGNTDSFNWPQGAMMQWLSGSGNEDKVIYNCSKDGKLISKIHDISTGETKDINWSIYGLTPDGKKSITLNFERSYWCRAYHYESVVNNDYDTQIAEDDGIYEIDLTKNKRKRIISIREIINTDKEQYFEKAKHWIEHIMVSPSGTRFCFLHRFAIGDINNYETRLFISDIDGSNLQIIKGWREFSWSHFGWANDDSFTIYTYESARRRSYQLINKSQTSSSNSVLFIDQVKNLRSTLVSLIPVVLKKKIRKLLKGRTTYYQFYTIKNDIFELVDNWKLPLFDIDGHPSFTNDSLYMITDTYPDKKKFQHLIIFDKEKRKTLPIASIYAALHQKPGSCDLHPKLCANNNYLVIDTAYDGKHHMMLFRIDWEQVKIAFSKM